MGNVHNVLFLCTGNSARSILAEAVLNHCGGERFRGYSAGSHPKGTVHPLALKLLDSLGMPTVGLRSKSWEEFAQPGAPSMDFIITVCDDAAGEVCPVWPGRPITAHWGMPDPAAVAGSELHVQEAFRDAFRTIERRVKLLVALTPEALERSAAQIQIADIGRSS
ncbi:MAG: arsenate reductase ArsC [Gemmatimonas sp.]